MDGIHYPKQFDSKFSVNLKFTIQRYFVYLVEKYSIEQQKLLHRFIEICIDHYENELNDDDPIDDLVMFTECDAKFMEKILNEYCLFQSPEDECIVVNKPEFDSRYAQTPIHLFAFSKSGDKFLQFFLQQFSRLNIEQKANIFCPSSGDLVLDVSPLWIATLFGMINQMSLLLKYGADPNTISSTGSTPIRLCCGICSESSQDRNIELLELLLKHKADVNKPNKFRNTPLMLAAYNGQEKIVQFLLDNGADPNRAAYCGGTPLHFAVELEEEEEPITIIEMLLQHGAILQPDISGFTPLFLAAFMNIIPVVNILLSWEEKSNQLTIENRITVYELLAAGCCINSSYDDTDNNNVSEQMKNFLRSAYHLRYLPLNYDGNFDNIQMFKCNDRKALPIRSKNVHRACYAYDFVQ
ncbi:Fem-1-like protein, partial [Euroglyphus maynei]